LNSYRAAAPRDTPWAGIPLVEDSVRDLRHAVRVLRRAPGFAAATLVTLALGIGATAAIVSLVRTVMLEPLPYHEPDRIVTLWETTRGGTGRNVIALDPWTFAVTALVLLVVATVASYLPARRGMHMTPVDALRTN
jgi:ABC-type antimicrobial peptide transport system permease subunit